MSTSVGEIYSMQILVNFASSIYTFQSCIFFQIVTTAINFSIGIVSNNGQLILNECHFSRCTEYWNGPSCVLAELAKFESMKCLYENATGYEDQVMKVTSFDYSDAFLFHENSISRSNELHESSVMHIIGVNASITQSNVTRAKLAIGTVIALVLQGSSKVEHCIFNSCSSDALICFIKSEELLEKVISVSRVKIINCRAYMNCFKLLFPIGESKIIFSEVSEECCIGFEDGSLVSIFLYVENLNSTSGILFVDCSFNGYIEGNIPSSMLKNTVLNAITSCKQSNDSDLSDNEHLQKYSAASIAIVSAMFLLIVIAFIAAITAYQKYRKNISQSHKTSNLTPDGQETDSSIKNSFEENSEFKP